MAFSDTKISSKLNSIGLLSRPKTELPPALEFINLTPVSSSFVTQVKELSFLYASGCNLPCNKTSFATKSLEDITLFNLFTILIVPSSPKRLGILTKPSFIFSIS